MNRGQKLSRKLLDSIRKIVPKYVKAIILAGYQDRHFTLISPSGMQTCLDRGVWCNPVQNLDPLGSLDGIGNK